MYYWKGGEGLGLSLDNPRGVDNKHMHLVTVQWQSPPGWDRRRANCGELLCLRMLRRVMRARGMIGIHVGWVGLKWTERVLTLSLLSIFPSLHSR